MGVHRDIVEKVSTVVRYLYYTRRLLSLSQFYKTKDESHPYTAHAMINYHGISGTRVINYSGIDDNTVRFL